jgi:outer membrane receptor protein involved in Fe transport
MRKLKILLLLQVCLLLPWAGMAQQEMPFEGMPPQGQMPFPGNPPAKGSKLPVSGKVIDANSEEVLPFVNVVLLSAKDSTLIDGTVTNEKGFFLLKNVKPNSNFILKLSFIGYKDVYRNIKLKDKPLNVGTLSMSTNSEILEGVEIVAERQMMEYKLDKRVINVEKNLVSAGGDASDVLENVPSVSVDEDGAVSLRGNSNVKVLIDGKPSELLGNDLATVLSQIPASTIANIEVITNPSAKYDPEGMSGIINIKLKEKGNKGLSGNINLTGGSAIEKFFPRTNGSAGISYSTKKWGFSASVDGRFNERGRRSDNMKLLFNQARDGYDAWMRSQQTGNSSNLSGGGKIGFDWYINDKTSLTLSYNGRVHGHPTDEATIANENLLDQRFGEDTSLYSARSLDQITTGVSNGKFHTFSLNFTKQFNNPEQELMIDANWNMGGFYRESSQILDYWNPTIPNYEKKDISESNDDRAVVNINYSHPFSKTLKMEVGYNLNYSDRQSVYEYYLNGSEVRNDEMSYDFYSTEYINAIYATLGYSYGKWSGQLGLRGEIASSEGTKKMLNKEDDHFTKEYISPFPTLHLSYQITDMQSAQLSYSRRINRPNMFTMMPNVDLSSPEHIRFGNPNIDPEYTDAVELGYSIILPKTTIFTSAYYRQTNNRISWFNFLWTEENAIKYGFEWVLDVAGDEVDKGKLAMTSLNIDKSVNYGLELIIDQQITKWWKVNLSANFFGNYTDATIINDNEIKSFNWDAKLNSTMNLPHEWTIQTSAMYFAPRKTIQGESAARFFSDIAIKKNINKKATISLRYADIFRTAGHRSNTITDDYFSIRNGKPYRQSLTLNFSYRFGDGKPMKKMPKKRLDNGAGGETGGGGEGEE